MCHIVNFKYKIYNITDAPTTFKINIDSTKHVVDFTFHKAN